MIAVGGGGIGPMSARWERALSRYDAEKPRMQQAAQGSKERIAERVHARAEQAQSDWPAATFRVLGDEERCVVTMQEEPAARLIGNIVRPVMDPMMHVRNHSSLRRLAGVVESVGTQPAR